MQWYIALPQRGQPHPQRGLDPCAAPVDMTSPERAQELLNLIEELSNERLEQEDLDKQYDLMVDTYYAEMTKFMREIKKTPVSKSKVRNCRKYIH